MQLHAIVILLVMICFPLVKKQFAEGYNIADVEKLMSDKLQGYNKKIRPVLNQSHVVIIGVAVKLISIQDFDEVRGRFAAMAMINMTWRDEKMTWDPKDYNNVETIVLENGDLWRPKLVLANGFGKTHMIGQDWNIVRFSPNGFGTMVPLSMLDAICDVDVTYYPWDTQTCLLMLATVGYSHMEVQFEVKYNFIDTTRFTGSGSWEIKSTSAVAVADSTMLELKITIKRKPMFVFVNVILPIVFMSFCNSVVFLIPVETGERISYCLTVLLAIAVFLTLVGDNLPKTSSPMSIFSFYLLSVLITSLLMSFVTIINLRIYFCNEDIPVPEIIAKFVRILQCKKLRPKKQLRRLNNGITTVTPVSITNGSRLVHTELTGVESAQPSTCLGKRKNNDGEKKSHISHSDAESIECDIEGKAVTWKEVSVVIDKVCFVIFTFTLLCDSVMFWLTMRQEVYA